MLARFNEHFQSLYDLLRQVENIKLSPECLEPEPVDIDTIRGTNKGANRYANLNGSELWSGEATRNQGFAVEETRVDITIGASNAPEAVKTKDRPIWMTESTVITNDNKSDAADSQASAQPATTARGRKDNEDIMSVLLQHEKQPGKSNSTSAAAVKGLASAANSSDSSEDEREIENTEIRKNHLISFCFWTH